ncbi:MAG: hypothetical protein Q8O37_01670 [Sulfuricellaceae bacterium]|nr:hypothetical protein [Sulfuricellaceae bacterium]
MTPDHRKIEALSDYGQAVDEIIGLATHSLKIFDINLRGAGYNSPVRIELLQNFLHLNRANRLIIILHDTNYLQRECPRLIGLLRLFSHSSSVYQTTDEAKSVSDPFIIADETHYLHRFHYEYPRALLALNDPEGALDTSRRFNEILNASEPSAPATTLGL